MIYSHRCVENSRFAPFLLAVVLTASAGTAGTEAAVYDLATCLNRASEVNPGILAADTDVRAELLRIADIFRGKVVDVSPKTYTLEVTGDEGKISAVIDALKPFGIKEIARTGMIAMGRGNRILK